MLLVYCNNLYESVDTNYILDTSGKPLTVYHGTDSEFEHFDGSSGYWFITDEEEAMEYGSKVFKCNLVASKVAQSSHRENTKIGAEALISKYKGQGYDAIHLPVDHKFSQEHVYYEADFDVYIVFSPNQIKIIH